MGLLKKAGKYWFFRGIAVCLACAVIYSSFYGVFRTRAGKYEESPLETTENIAWLFQNSYLLYRDLYNAKQGETLDYAEIYLKPEEGYQWILDSEKLDGYIALLEALMNGSGLGEDSGDTTAGEEAMDREWLEEAARQESLDQNLLEEYIEEGILDSNWQEEYLDDSGVYNLTWSECVSLRDRLEAMQKYFGSLEENFRSLNSCYGYIIEDHATGQFVTNMSQDARNRGYEDQYFLLSFIFDSSGNVSIGEDICGKNEGQVRKYGNEAARVSSLKALLADTEISFGKYGKVCQPVDCTVTYAVSRDEWEEARGSFCVAIGVYDSYMFSIGYSPSYIHSNYSVDAYFRAGLMGILQIAMLLLALLGFILPVKGGAKPWRDEKFCSFPLEILFCVGCLICAAAEGVVQVIAYIASGTAGGAFSSYLGISSESGQVLAYLLNLAVLTAFFFGCWYIGICARAIREFGLKAYIKTRSLIYRFFPFIKEKFILIYASLAHMDLTKDSNKTIIKLLLINGVVLFLISSLWIGGFAITLVYSLLLYFVLRRYISELQKRYRILLKAVDEIAAGNLNVTIEEDLGVFEPFREQVLKIQDGLKKAVDAEVRSQRMKVELVTNMSHDLKTPLTAIITYVDLLKEQDITEEQRREYLDTLERKSLRLKGLIEDLFEFSKANSQNITLNIMDVDIMNLVKQVAFEMSDKIGGAGLDVRMNLTEEKVVLPLDSQKTFRIYENLFGNIAKYALPGTRVYVNGFRIDDTIVITLKNISAQEITVDSSELTERFVRGDASRNTEGSGLGLAIAKSFTELQGGELSLEVDGDLFKVTTTWHIKQPSDEG